MSADEEYGTEIIVVEDIENDEEKFEHCDCGEHDGGGERLSFGMIVRPSL